jgi:hypothetical protein
MDLHNKNEIKVCNCKWCGQKTDFTGTKECGRCWELRHRIETDMELAEMILNVFKAKKEMKS